MACFRPRIWKIQENLIHFLRCEHLFHISCVHADKPDIGQSFIFLCIKLFQRSQKHTGITLDSDKVHIGMSLCHIQNKLPLTHSDFYIDRMPVSKHLMPASSLIFRSFNHCTVHLDHALCTRDISKSHVWFLLRDSLYIITRNHFPVKADGLIFLWKGVL